MLVLGANGHRQVKVTLVSGEKAFAARVESSRRGFAEVDNVPSNHSTRKDRDVTLVCSGSGLVSCWLGTDSQC